MMTPKEQPQWSALLLGIKAELPHHRPKIRGCQWWGNHSKNIIISISEGENSFATDLGLSVKIHELRKQTFGNSRKQYFSFSFFMLQPIKQEFLPSHRYQEAVLCLLPTLISYTGPKYVLHQNINCNKTDIFLIKK